MLINIIVKSIVKDIVYLSFWYQYQYWLYDTNTIRYIWYGIYSPKSTSYTMYNIYKCPNNNYESAKCWWRIDSILKIINERIMNVSTPFQANHLFKCLMSAELPGVDYVEDVLRELEKEIEVVQQATKANHKVAKVGS